jgi:hypothetical protein
MSDDAGHGAAGAPAAPAAAGAPGAGRGHSDVPLSVNVQAAQGQKVDSNISSNNPQIEEIASLTSPRLITPNPFSRKNTSLDLDDYFVCNRLTHGVP